MSLNVINDARRDLCTLINRVQAGCLDPATFKAITERLQDRLDEIDAYLEVAGPLPDVELLRARDGLVAIPVNRMRTVFGLAVIDGGKA